MTRQFIQNDLIPPLIKNDFRKEYLEAMNDEKKLSNFLELAQVESYKIIDKDFELSQKKTFKPKDNVTNTKK